MDGKYDHRWAQGPRIVAIGGGHGLSTLLRGLKVYTRNLTAIVTVADDGGGSGVLRSDLGMPPPGDIRNCMEALANTEPVMEKLLTYRFTEGSLAGQSFGNLILAALNGITGSFEEAVSEMSHVLAISGRILPVTSADVKLEATFENGAAILGESKIADFKKAQDCRIRGVRLIPERPTPVSAAIQALREANLILLGPGSLYTSVIPNLLVDEVTEAICESDALRVYIGTSAPFWITPGPVWWMSAWPTAPPSPASCWSAIRRRGRSPFRWIGKRPRPWGWRWWSGLCSLPPPGTPATPPTGSARW